MTENEKYDLVLHIVNELKLPVKEQIRGVTELFPKFHPKKETPAFEEKITDYFLEMYSYNRSLGLKPIDAAHACEASNTFITKILAGDGISLKTFVKVIEAELYGAALMKRKHLNTLDKSSEGGSIRGAVAFLEKVYPSHYGPKSTVVVDASEDVKKKWEIEVTNVNAIEKKQG